MLIKELVEELGISRVTYWNWRSGRLSQALRKIKLLKGHPEQELNQYLKRIKKIIKSFLSRENKEGQWKQ